MVHRHLCFAHLCYTVTMSVPDSESTPALEVLLVRCTCQELYPAHHQCTGPIFHRDSFDIYRETRCRKGKRKGRKKNVEEDTEEEEGDEKPSSMNQFISKIRQAWSTLPWSAAVRGRERKPSGFSSTDEDPDKDMSAIWDDKLDSISLASKHAHFADEDPRSVSTCRNM